MDRINPFENIENRIRHCFDAAIKAWVEIRCAQQELAVHHPQGTRSMDLQRSAVRLAVAYFEFAGRGQARIRAKQIIQLAGLPQPDESTISKWIKEARSPPSTPD